MDFIFMLTRNDRTVEDAGCLVEQVCDLGVTHVGFKDVGVPATTMRELVAMIRERGGKCYLEVVSTTPEAMIRSLETGVTLGVDQRQEHQEVERLEGQQVVWLRHTGPVSILPNR